jgi:hypothetical protein
MRITPEDLNDVEVATARGTTVIPWATRAALLERLAHLKGADETRLAFEAAGMTLPVILTLAQQGMVVRAIDEWSSEIGLQRLPDGIAELHQALADPFDPYQPSRTVASGLSAGTERVQEG